MKQNNKAMEIKCNTKCYNVGTEDMGGTDSRFEFDEHILSLQGKK